MKRYCRHCLGELLQRADGEFFCWECDQPEEVSLLKLPPSWEPNRMAEELLDVECTILVWIAVHGAVALAAKHPLLTASVLAMLAEFLTQLETSLEDVGIEPPDTGWRAWINPPVVPPD